LSLLGRRPVPGAHGGEAVVPADPRRGDGPGPGRADPHLPCGRSPGAGPPGGGRDMPLSRPGEQRPRIRSPGDHQVITIPVKACTSRLNGRGHEHRGTPAMADGPGKVRQPRKHLHRRQTLPDTAAGRSLTLAPGNYDGCADRVGSTDRDAHTGGSVHGHYGRVRSAFTSVDNAPPAALERILVKAGHLAHRAS